MTRLVRLLRGHSHHVLCVTMLCLGLAAPARAASPTLVPQPGVTTPASIAELARALKNDVNLIYEYVYTNIDYSPTYGLKKGPLGTLLDGRGNDFDQAALMVALLRQAGYTASYVYGQIRLSPAQLTNWLGVNTSNPCTVGTLLGKGGIPVTLNVSGPLDCTGTLVSADIAHVRVSVTGGSLGTTTYVCDPSFKTNTTPSTGINLATAMGYSQASFLASAQSGATVTANSIQNVNTANLQSALTGYANNLVSYIKANMPTATLKDIVGGSYIQPLTQPYTPQTSLPYQTPGDSPQTWTGDVPNQYRTTLAINIGGIAQTYYADQIYGHRLGIVYNTSSQPVLYLDGVVQGTGSTNADTVMYTVDFPFCFKTDGSASVDCGSVGGVNYTNIFTFQNKLRTTAGYSYAIVNGWDFSGRGMVEFHRRQLQTNQAAGSSAGSEPVLGEALNMIGYAWLAQLSALADLQDRLIGSKVVTHCAVGVVGQVDGPYIDIPGGFVGASSLTSDTNRAVTAFFGHAGHGSAFEWDYPTGTSTITYVANALNQYTAVGAVTPTYDANGNLTFDGTFTYGYDAENRLISASGAGNTVSYAYDAQGRRKRKTVNGVTTLYVTDADNREVLEYDGTSGQVLRWYAYGAGSSDVLDRLDVVAGTRQTLIPDLQGSALATLDSSTAALTKRGYLPYGASAGVTGSFAYAGQRIDAETNGLYYARARMYAPGFGRFLQPDPIGYAGGKHLDAYVGNDPLNRVDPSGLSAYLAQNAGSGNGYEFGDSTGRSPEDVMTAGPPQACSSPRTEIC